MATIKEHLLTLDEPYRSQALANTAEHQLSKELGKHSTGLLNAFIWDDSPEGHQYWSITSHYYKKRHFTQLSECCNQESEPRGADLEAVAVCAGCGRPFVPRYETMEEFKERLNIE